VASPAEILEYFAELAPVGRGPRWDHSPARGDIAAVTTPWDVSVSGDDGALVVDSETADLWRLWSAARINGSPDFLRLGWMFLAGTTEVQNKTTRVFLPVASAPVRLRRQPAAGGRQSYQIVADAELSVPETVFADHVVRRRLNEDLDQLVDDGFVSESSIVRWTHMRPFIDRFCDEAGLPRVKAIGEMAPPGAAGRPGLALYMGLAVYTSRNRTSINLESTLREWSGEKLSCTALESVYADHSGGRLPDLSHAVANSLPLNRAQEEAILTARHNPVTVVSGPPGTGKTHTAVALAIDQIAHGNSVLIATQSSDAVDAVESLLGRFVSPRHIRFGSQASRKRVAVELSDGLVADPSASTTSSHEAVDRLESLEKDLDEIEARVLRRLVAEEEFITALGTRRANAWCHAEVPGLNELLASEKRCAEVEGLFADRQSSGWIAGVRRAAANRRLKSVLGLPATRLDELGPTVVTLIEAERAVRRGQSLAGGSISAAFEQMEGKAAEVRRTFGRHVETLRSGRSWDPGASRAVGRLATALRSGRAARRKALRTIEIDAALKALPLWLGTIADIDDVLPIRPGMFDVVIIDEASQVNQVRAATSLARGDRAVIIGDPRQLRHVSFVGDEAMRRAARRVGLEAGSPLLDIRRNSLFDVAAGTTPILQLSEHYRSTPHLIDFSSKQFYGGRLQLMTEHPALSTEDVIHHEQVAGERDAAGVVLAEVERIMDLVEGAAAERLTSVGVVTPFRAQSDAITQAAQGRLSPQQIEDLDLRIGTVHGFQGNERDFVLVSLGVDPTDLRPLRFVEDPNLFNVMITRARRSLSLIMSIDPADLRAGLLFDYIRHADNAPAGPPNGTGRQAGWVGDVAGALRPFGLPMWERYPVGNYEVDIVVGEGDAAIGVECVIHPDGVRAHIDRHVALRRAGWELMTAMESRWLARPEDAAQAIAQQAVARAAQI